jgi:hypothetical protein
MTNPAIRAALEAAKEAVNDVLLRPVIDVLMAGKHTVIVPERQSENMAAAAVAAFLRALPDHIPLGDLGTVYLSRTSRSLMAQAVERAAREGGG